ncbi:MAG: hypothetical protein LBQ63_00310 [Deltaproteobacteria bacterium]|jgi:hypothetical protein|nr:hypothetical protein [Deltaproteobacteria bacterium]
MIAHALLSHPAARKSPLRRILIYFGLLLLFWVLLFFVIIPWENGGEIPEDGFALIEGQRAYAMLLREKRPTLAVTIRGLHMAGAPYNQKSSEEGRVISSGNIRIHYDRNGEFVRLDIARSPSGDF